MLFVAVGVKKHKTVPPITDKLKSEIPLESLAIIERARETTLKWREAAEKNFKQCLKNHNQFVGLCKDQAQHLRNLEQAKSGAVHPAPPGGAAMQPPLSSSYGLQQQASARAAANANANRNAGAGANPQNPNGKK
jgi:hypothetical protein